MKNYIILTILVVLGFVSCKKDREEFIVKDENVYTSTIVGLVTDENEDPISGAVVDYKGTTTSTDAYGFYKITNVQVGDIHNFLTVTKPGYFEGCRTFRTNKKGSIYTKTQLLALQFDASFQSASGGDFTSDGVAFSFPANAIVNESSGAAYNGEVQVAVRHIDPIEGSSAFQMPGDLSEQGENGDIDLLRSYGMVAVEMRSPSGEKLQVKEGNTVTMTAEIPAELQAEAPSDIPMWHFNQNSGLWEEEGMAIKQGSKYVAEVSHFSYWNYDIKEESIILSGRLVDENGDPISGAHILVSATDASWGGHGNTNLDGTFSGRVTKNKTLNISVLINGSCRGQRIPITQVGPFSSNTSIGDITFNTAIVNQGSMFITAKFVDCNGNAVTDGVVVIDGSATLISGGQISVIKPYCGQRPASIDVRAVDRTAQKEVQSSIAVTADNVNLGRITVCGADADFVEVKSTALNYDELFDINVSLEFLPGDTTFLAAATGANQSGLTLYFEPQGASTGTFNISLGYITIRENNGQTGYPKFFFNYAVGVPGTITITDNPAKQRREGSYSVTLMEEGSSTPVTFTGNFRVNY